MQHSSFCPPRSHYTHTAHKPCAQRASRCNSFTSHCPPLSRTHSTPALCAARVKMFKMVTMKEKWGSAELLYLKEMLAEMGTVITLPHHYHHRHDDNDPDTLSPLIARRSSTTARVAQRLAPPGWGRRACAPLRRTAAVARAREALRHVTWPRSHVTWPRSHVTWPRSH
eukprot:3380653-Prymnesium_polylepis.1